MSPDIRKHRGAHPEDLREIAARQGWEWSVDVAFNPDAEMASASAVVITSDGPLLDRVKRWTNVARFLIGKRLADSWSIDLS